VVFSGEVDARTARDPRVKALRDRLAAAGERDLVTPRAALDATLTTVRAEMFGALAAEFEAVHDIHRAVEVGSVDGITRPANCAPTSSKPSRTAWRGPASGPTAELEHARPR
jgi:hypothetical protein